VTVKVPTKGTRGVPFPHFLMRLGNRMVIRQFRRRGMRTRGGVASLLLETQGAKSGKPRLALLGYIDEGGGSWLVIASAVAADLSEGCTARASHKRLWSRTGRRTTILRHVCVEQDNAGVNLRE